jgi:hypothetical protein
MQPDSPKPSDPARPDSALGPEQSEILYQLWLAETKAYALTRAGQLTVESLRKGLTIEQLEKALKPSFANIDQRAVTAFLMSMRHFRWSILGEPKPDKTLKSKETGAKPKRYRLADDGEIVRRKLTATLALRRYAYGGRESRAALADAFKKETGLELDGETGIEFRIDQLLKMGYFNPHPTYADGLTYKDTRIDSELLYLIKIANHRDPVPDRYI